MSRSSTRLQAGPNEQMESQSGGGSQPQASPQAQPVEFDVVFLFGVPWDSPRQRPHHLASSLATAHRILYVEHSTRRRSEAFRPLLRRVEGRVTCLRVPFMTQPFEPSVIRRLQVRILAAALRLLVSLLGLRNVVVIHCDFYSADFIGRLGEDADIYDCADDHAAFPWANPRTADLEDELSRKCDLVLAVSDSLVAARRGVARGVALVPNAAEVERFALTGPERAPAHGIKEVPRPILGYTGAVYQWMDFDLLARLARAHQEWHIVLVGPVRVPLDALGGLKNVHALGLRPYETLPDYIRAFDVALVPFKVDALTRSADLIKVYEYLASGTPVVGTDLPSLRRFGDVVRIGSDYDSFERAIVAALGDRSPASTQRRIDSVRGQDWSSRAALVERLIVETLARKRPVPQAARVTRSP